MKDHLLSNEYIHALCLSLHSETCLAVMYGHDCEIPAGTFSYFARHLAYFNYFPVIVVSVDAVPVTFNCVINCI